MWIGIIVAAIVIGLYFAESGFDAGHTTTEPRASESAPVSAAVAKREIRLHIEPVPVEVAIAKKRKLIQNVRATGYTEALREISIIPEQGGQIAELPIRENMRVKRGQLLFALNSDEQSRAFIDVKNKYTSKLTQYALELGLNTSISVDILVQAEKRFWASMDEEIKKAVLETRNREGSEALSDRLAQRTWKGKKTKYDRLWLIAGRVGLITAWTDLERARVALEQTRLHAPFSGHIVDLKPFSGSWIKSGEEVLRLVNLEKVIVNARVLESEVRHIDVGTPAQVTFVAYPDNAYTGKVGLIRSAVDSETGTCEVRIMIDNSDFRLKPGMFANARIAARVYSRRLVVKTDAILNRDERDVVFVVENGLAKWRYIASGLKNAVFTEISKGVQEGDSVIVSGHYNLAHETPVTVVKTIAP